MSLPNISYDNACFEARVKIYQSINPSFYPDIELRKTLVTVIYSVDSNLFLITRKSLIQSKQLKLTFHEQRPQEVHLRSLLLYRRFTHIYQ